LVVSDGFELARDLKLRGMTFFSHTVTLECEEGVLGIVKEPWELWKMGSVAY
jgi:hypothetical protein